MESSGFFCCLDPSMSSPDPNFCEAEGRWRRSAALSTKGADGAMFGRPWRANGCANRDEIRGRCRRGPWAAVTRVWRGGSQRFGVSASDGADRKWASTGRLGTNRALSFGVAMLVTSPRMLPKFGADCPRGLAAAARRSLMLCGALLTSCWVSWPASTAVFLGEKGCGGMREVRAGQPGCIPGTHMPTA